MFSLPTVVVCLFIITARCICSNHSILVGRLPKNEKFLCVDWSGNVPIVCDSSSNCINSIIYLMALIITIKIRGKSPSLLNIIQY